MAARRASVFRAGWPLALATVGRMFLTHEQRGTGQAWSGATGPTAGWASPSSPRVRRGLAEVVTGWRPLRWAWPPLLLGAAAELVAYREAEGAYEEAAHAEGHNAG